MNHIYIYRHQILILRDLEDPHFQNYPIPKKHQEKIQINEYYENIELLIYKSHPFLPYIQKSDFQTYIFFKNRNIFIQQLLFILNKWNFNKKLAVILIQFQAHLFIKRQRLQRLFYKYQLSHKQKYEIIKERESRGDISFLQNDYKLPKPTKAPIMDADSTLIQQQIKNIFQFSSELDKEGELNILSENEAFIILFQPQQYHVFLSDNSGNCIIQIIFAQIQLYCDICAQKSLREQINCYTVKINYKSHKIKMFTYVYKPKII
ncbi:hypothetical protein pb186bvf_021031 [Paramecium bursaria]